jgi:hypothetical protein
MDAEVSTQLNFQGEIFFTQNWCNIALSRIFKKMIEWNHFVVVFYNNLIIPLPTKLRRDIVMLPSFRNILFQILLRTKYVPCLVKIHWRMLILECS